MGGGDLERDNMAELIFFRIHLTLDVFQHAIAVRGMKVADSQVWEQGSLHDSPVQLAQTMVKVSWTKQQQFPAAERAMVTIVVFHF